MRYPFLLDHKEHYPVQLMCDILQVSRSGFYDWVNRPQSPQAQASASTSTLRPRASNFRLADLTTGF